MTTQHLNGGPPPNQPAEGLVLPRGELILAFGVVASVVVAAVLTVSLAFVAESGTMITVLVGLATITLGTSITLAAGIHAGIQRALTANLLAGRLQSAARVRTELERIVGAATDAESSGSSFLRDQFKEALGEAALRAERLAAGSFACRSREDELRLIVRALRSCRAEVRAVADRGMDWWGKPEADVYFRAYAREAERLEISRVFIVDPDELEAIQSVVELHRENGISAWAVDAGDVPEFRRRGVVVFDHELVHQASATRARSLPEDIEFSAVPSEVERAIEDFEFARELARVVN